MAWGATRRDLVQLVVRNGVVLGLLSLQENPFAQV